MKRRLYSVTVLLALLACATLGSATYAVLSATTDPYLPSNQTENCAVYNSHFSYLNTVYQPAPEDFIPAVNDTQDPYGCTQLPVESLLDQAVVVDHGNCTFYEKAYYAQAANASLLVIVYNESKASVPKLSGNISIRIPVLIVDNKTGQHLLGVLATSPLYLYGYRPPYVVFDPSYVVVAIVAIVTVFLGAFIANTPYEFMRYGLLIRKGSVEAKLNQLSFKEKLKKANKTVQCAMLAIVVCCWLVPFLLVCIMFALLYVLYYPMVYVFLAFYCLVAVLTLCYLLSPYVALIPEKCRLPPNKIPILNYRPGPLAFLTLLFSIAVVTWWVVERHSVYGWVIHDILGFALVAYLYKVFSFLIKPWLLAIFMCLFFFYDIFFVFITPLFTKNGVSVLERLVVGPAGSTEKLPFIFAAIRFIYPTKLDMVCSLARSSTFLGYGDVIIPGLLVTLALKHDLQHRPNKYFKIYYATVGVAYIVGLVCTYIALTFMKRAQPALLYLVPTTLLSVIILSLIRREFRLFFAGKPKESKDTGQNEDKGQSTEVNIENETNIDEELQGQVNDTENDESPLVDN